MTLERLVKQVVINDNLFIRIRNSIIVILISTFYIVFLQNMEWVKQHAFGESQAKFIFRPIIFGVAILLVVAAFFFEEIKRIGLSLDGYLAEKAVPGLTVKTGAWDFPKYFLFIGLAFGVFFVFLTPPFNAPDEPDHFRQAFFVAHGQLFPLVDKNGTGYGMVSNDYINFGQAWAEVPFDPSKKIDYQTLLSYFYSAADNAPVQAFYRYPDYPFTLYLPQAAGLVIGKIVFSVIGFAENYNTMNQMYFARLFNLFFYVASVYWGIKLTPVFKRTFFLIALMPMTLFQAAGCGPDAIIFGVAFLFAAWVFRLAYDNQVSVITLKMHIAMAFLTIMLALSKFAYAPLGLLCLLIPASKFGGTKSKLLHISGYAACALLFLVLWKLVNSYFLSGSTGGYIYSFDPAVAAEYAASEKLQMQFVMKNPVKFLTYVLYDLFPLKKYITSFIGTFGWLDTHLPVAAIGFYATFLFVSGVLEEFKFKLSLRARMAIIGSALISVLLIETAQYIFWTPHPNVANTIGGSIISGVQGRYFIPLAPVLFFGIANRISTKSKIIAYINVGFGKSVPGLVTASLSVSALFIFLRYWI